MGIHSDYDLVEHIRAHRSVTDIPKVDSENFLVVISTEPLETVGSVVSLLPALRQANPYRKHKILNIVSIKKGVRVTQ